MNPFKSVGRLKDKVEMNIFEKIVAGLIERSCKNYVTTIIGVIDCLAYVVNRFSNAIPAQYHGEVGAAIAFLSAVALILAKDSGSKPVPEGPGPIVPPPPPPSIKTAAMVVLALLLIPTLHAQAVTNFYAAGATYNVNASPSVAGTVLYAKKLADSNTYAFTALDMVPNTVKPYTVTTNMGVGVAQKLTTIGKVDIFTPLAAGISTSGPNLGWQYNFGIMPTIRIKGPYYIAPTVRFNKSSVSNGTGVQPLIGILFGFGQ